MFEQYAWIGLGGNMGKMADTLLSARRALRRLSEGPMLFSPVYQSAPWGVLDQNAFLNQVVALVPSGSPDTLMEALLNIETNHGRDRKTETRWGPRCLDLDLLAWPTPQPSARVSLPHPRLHLRRFVLQPWCDLAPTFVPTGLSESVQVLLKTCEDSGECIRTSEYYAL